MIGLNQPSKQDLKYQKLLNKEIEDLHKGQQNMNRRTDDRVGDSDPEDQYIDRKGKKWWQRFDQRHFKVLSSRDYLQLRDLTTSDRILQQSPRQSLPMLTYAQYKIINEYDLFQDSNLIHILFKAKQPKYRCISSFSLEQNIELPQSLPEKVQTTFYRVVPNPLIKFNQKEDIQTQNVKLILTGYNEDSDLCRSIDHFNRTLQKYPSKNQLEMEIHLYQKELYAVNKDNHLAWDRVIKNIKKDRTRLENKKQIQDIRNELMWSTVLKYFQHGFSDKTSQQLQQLIDSQKLIKPAKSKSSTNIKFFQTDCKICFCSFNNDSNQVLYCDNCNTSFHLACYGLQELPKDETYYCDYCRAVKQENSRKLICQLCNKTKFPMKQIQGHYYHVTCLMLFNLVEIDKGTLIFRKNINHPKILQMVVESELNLKQCEFCANSGGSLMGIRMKCGFAGCDSSSHPICAYINGCKFWVRRDSIKKKLDISYHCNMHNDSRDWIKQTYLRRYMCNFRKTSEMKQSTFRLQFQQQMAKTHQAHKDRNSWDNSKIIHKTRFLIKKMNWQEQKQANTSAEVQTQTMKMLQKLKKRK